VTQWRRRARAVAAGERLDRAHALELADVSRHGLRDLLQCARQVRALATGTTVTFSPKVFIPLTKACRDVCHYCTFARAPVRGERVYLTPDEVLAVAAAGADAGCTEALFTLGDKPELRYSRARQDLHELGFPSTLAYLRHCAKLVLEQAGLLPHLNPGVMSPTDLQALREVSASMGLMVESTAERRCECGGPHHGSPDKRPAVRLEAIAEAGKQAIPFTTGILIGIGETRQERVEALLAIRDLHERHGHIQEVIVQSFRAKAGTVVADAPEPDLDELLWSAAVARLVLPLDVAVQAPPNLSAEFFPRLLDAGINDWGGVSPLTPDHVNPEAPWPAIDALERATEAHGLRLAPRLPVYPRYLADPDRWLAPAVRPRVLALSDADGLARAERWRAGRPEPPPPALRSRHEGTGRAPGPPPAQLTSPVREALAAAADGEQLDEDHVEALLRARGADLVAVCAAADELRRKVVGDEVTFVVNRNINYTNVCYFRCTFCAFSKGRLAGDLRGKPYLLPLEEIVRRSAEAWTRGATEVCLQGGIHPGFDGHFYERVVEAIKQSLPDLHVHAFSPLEIWQGAATLGIGLEDYLRRLQAAGLGSLPGTSAEILDDDVRRLICPDKNTTAQWLEVMEIAHRLGLPSTSTIMFGHVDRPRHWARHVLVLREAQKRGGGFTEFVPLPFVHMEAPIARRGRSRHGPTFREAMLMHAVGRLALHPWITNIQTSWVKLGPDGARAMLRAGANDVGGTLMNESISRAAGASHGQELAPERMEQLIRSLGRIPRQRTTLYAPAPAERRRAARGAPPLTPPVNPPARESGLPSREHLIRPGLA
jgi:FO synthase